MGNSCTQADMKYATYSRLESLFDYLAHRCTDIAQRFAICRDCGRNRYTGKSCKNLY